MKCQENRQLIYTYLDGELSTYQERSLYNHLANCEMCQKDMETSRKLNQLLEKTIRHVEPPPDFAQKVMANLPSRPGDFSKSQYLGKDADHNQENDKQQGHKALKGFNINKRWLGVAAGIMFILLSLAGLNQVTQIAFDPKAEEGYFLAIQPKDYHELIEKHHPDKTAPENQTPDGNQEGQAAGIGDEQKSDGAPDKTDDNSIPDKGMLADNGDGDSQGTKGQDGEKDNIKDSEGQHLVAAADPDETETFEIEEPFAVFNATSAVTLTSLKEQVGNVTWSKNANLLMYTIKDEDKYRVYESLKNGEEKKPISSFSSTGRWSPNKEVILYTENVNGFNSIMVESRGEKINLTPGEKDAAVDGSKWAYNPVWSNKGEIAFLTDRFGETEVMVVDLEGNSRRVTELSGSKSSLAWSPDGTQIAFHRSFKDNGTTMGEIVVVSADGKNAVSVTPAVKAKNMSAAWSPDGKLLAVNIDGEEQQKGIWLANIDNQDFERRLTGKGGGKTIKWSSDGQKIAFNDSQGVFHILIWKSSQSNIEVSQITPVANQLLDAYIEWSRDSRELLIEHSSQENGAKNVWIATLPKSVNVY